MQSVHYLLHALNAWNVKRSKIHIPDGSNAKSRDENTDLLPRNDPSPKNLGYWTNEHKLPRMKSTATPRVLDKDAWPNHPEHKAQYTKHQQPRKRKRPDVMNSKCINNNQHASFLINENKNELYKNILEVREWRVCVCIYLSVSHKLGIEELNKSTRTLIKRTVISQVCWYCCTVQTANGWY